jgi:hypothetical protein
MPTEITSPCVLIFCHGVVAKRKIVFDLVWRKKNGVALDEKALNDSEGSFGT